ncbi:hypothetical protein B0E54_05000 [Micromonospora sp. MH99]|nr:hypothetical protein [Micromonospora sp. MH99]
MRPLWRSSGWFVGSGSETVTKDGNTATNSGVVSMGPNAVHHTVIKKPRWR